MGFQIALFLGVQGREPWKLFWVCCHGPRAVSGGVRQGHRSVFSREPSLCGCHASVGSRVRCRMVSFLFPGPGLVQSWPIRPQFPIWYAVLPRALRMLSALRRVIEQYSSEAPEDFLIPVGTMVPGFLEMPQRSAPAVATASGLLACLPSLPERVASWRGCPRVQSPQASLHRGSSMLSPRSTGTVAPGPATCQLGLPQPDRHPQPGYKSRVPWDPAPSSPKEAGGGPRLVGAPFSGGDWTFSCHWLGWDSGCAASQFLLSSISSPSR